MDVATSQLIVTLVGSLGFPIVMCFALFWKMNNDEKSRREDSAKIVESNTKTTEAINNNTLVVTKLVERMDKEGK